MENKENITKLEKFYEGLSDQISEDQYLDTILISEGVNPTELVKTGMETIRELQKNSRRDAVSSLVSKIKKKISTLENTFSEKALEKVENWLPQLDQSQLMQVYQNLNDEKVKFLNDNDLEKLKKDQNIRGLMKNIEESNN